MVDSYLLSSSFKKIVDSFEKNGWPQTTIITGFQFSQKKEWAEKHIKDEIISHNTSSLSTLQINHLLEENKHPDVFLFSEKSAIKIGSSSEPNTIRHMQKELLSFAPKYGKRRFVLFEHAEFFTEQAESSLLKILEEPPNNTFFILLVPRESNLKSTILSRGIRLSFRCIWDKPKFESLSNWDIIWNKLGYNDLTLFKEFEKSQLKSLVEETYNKLSLSSQDYLLFDTLFFDIIHKKILDSKYIRSQKQQFVKFALMPLSQILRDNLLQIPQSEPSSFIKLNFTDNKVIYKLLAVLRIFQERESKMYYGSIPISLPFVTVLLFQQITQYWPVQQSISLTQ